MKIFRVPLALLILIPALAVARPPEPLRLVISPAHRTWSLQERAAGGWRTLLADAHVRAIRTDGTEVAWTGMTLASDGHSFTLKSPDVSLKVVAQWVPASILPTTATLLPIAFASRPGLTLSEVDVADSASVPVVAPDAVALENGYQSWSRTEMRPVSVSGGVNSSVVTGIVSARRSCVAGFISNVLGVNTVHAETGADGVVLSVKSDFRSIAIATNSGGTPLDAMYLSWGRNPTEMLAQYAAAARVFTSIMDPPPAFKPWPIPTGWCSWYAYYGAVTEANVVSNFAAANRTFGARDFRVIQIDDGYQNNNGDWDTNVKFPHGHRWLVNQIHAAGYKAGLWLAPFVISQSSRVYQDHPEFLVRDASGQPIKRTDNASWGGAIYSLDPSVAGARRWLTDLFHTVTHDWGYDYVKIDFLYYPLEPNGAMQGGMTPVEAYRAGLKAIRAGCGPNTYILGCGAPVGPTIGLVNGNRIGPDVSVRWSGVRTAALNVANRQWMHNVWWQNDPDAMVLDTLTPDQARTWATATALSGGLALLTDDMTALPDDRAAIARRALVVTANGHAPRFAAAPPKSAHATGARPADFWTTHAAPAAGTDPPPRVWLLPSTASAAGITVAGLFNWDDAPRSWDFNAADAVGQTNGKPIHVWDVWDAKYLGTVTSTFHLDQTGGSTRLLALAPDAGHPQVLGTDNGLAAGAADLLNVTWLPKYRALKGASAVVPGRQYRIAVTVPAGWQCLGMEALGATTETEPSEKGSALFQLTPKHDAIRWVVRYRKQ